MLVPPGPAVVQAPELAHVGFLHTAGHGQDGFLAHHEGALAWQQMLGCLQQMLGFVLQQTSLGAQQTFLGVQQMLELPGPAVAQAPD